MAHYQAAPQSRRPAGETFGYLAMLSNTAGTGSGYACCPATGTLAHTFSGGVEHPHSHEVISADQAGRVHARQMGEPAKRPIGRPEPHDRYFDRGRTTARLGNIGRAGTHGGDR